MPGIFFVGSLGLLVRSDSWLKAVAEPVAPEHPSAPSAGQLPRHSWSEPGRLVLSGTETSCQATGGLPPLGGLAGVAGQQACLCLLEETPPLDARQTPSEEDLDPAVSSH